MIIGNSWLRDILQKMEQLLQKTVFTNNLKFGQGSLPSLLLCEGLATVENWLIGVRVPGNSSEHGFKKWIVFLWYVSRNYDTQFKNRYACRNNPKMVFCYSPDLCIIPFQQCIAISLWPLPYPSEGDPLLPDFSRVLMPFLTRRVPVFGDQISNRIAHQC